MVKDAGTGRVLREVAASIGTATNNVAEYRGLIAGLQAVLEIDPTADVEVRMDSKLVVEQMSGRWRVRHADMRVLAAEASALVRRLPGGVRFVHIPRERNSHADRLANEAMDAAAQGQAWQIREEVPTGQVVATPADSLPAPSPWLSGRTTTLVAIFARHGATALSGEGRLCGVTDVPLSAAGLEQARRLAEAVAGAGVSAIVSSPMRRCLQTAETIAHRLGLEVGVEEDLRETDFGVWEGLTLAEVAEGWPAQLARWRDDCDYPPPTGESLGATGARVREAIKRIREMHRGQRVLLVSHVTPIKLAVLQALGVGPQGVFRLHIDPAALTTLNFFDDDFALVRGLNETAHLS